MEAWHGRIRVGVAAFASLALGVALGLSLPTTAQQGDDASADRTVTATGTARVRSAPDEAVLSLGVQTEAQEANPAIRDNADRMSEVIQALLDAGISRDDIATTGISLYPNYSSDGRTVSSYVAQNTIEVTVHDVQAVGEILDAAVRAGANITNGVTFRLSDENEGRDEALRGAVEDARSKAEVLAEAGGASLGEVVSIQEASSSFPPPIFEERAVAADGATTPIIPPDIETQVSVTVAWALT
jgi:uncharacterized protein